MLPFSDSKEPGHLDSKRSYPVRAFVLLSFVGMSGTVASMAFARTHLGESSISPEDPAMEELPESWQRRFEKLQSCLCELLVRNQKLRMALHTLRETGEEFLDD